MAKFILEVPEGTTQCEHCPFADSEICENALWSYVGLDCRNYDFSEVEISDYKSLINKACKWLEKHINDDKYYSCIGEETLMPYFLEDFRRAMEK